MGEFVYRYSPPPSRLEGRGAGGEAFQLFLVLLLKREAVSRCRAPQLSTALHKTALCGHSCASHKMAAAELMEEVGKSLVRGHLTLVGGP